MQDNVVLVAVDQASFHFDKLYSYRLPPSAGEVTRGCRVLVPFGGGNRQRQGIVVRTDTAEDTARLKPIAQVLEREPLLDGEMMDLALWLKERTFCTTRCAPCCPPGCTCGCGPCCAWRRRRKTGWKR